MSQPRIADLFRWDSTPLSPEGSRDGSAIEIAKAFHIFYIYIQDDRNFFRYFPCAIGKRVLAFFCEFPIFLDGFVTIR